MVSFQYVTYAMVLPSTFLTVLLIYFVHKKSPSAMSTYKYVIMATCLAVYQFDLIVALLCPKVVLNLPGFEFHGLLGALFPTEGNRLLTLFVCSIIITGFSLLVSFVWREYSLLKFKATKLAVALQLFHFLCAAIPFAGLFPMLNRIFADNDAYIRFAYLIQAPIDSNYAIFTAILAKMQMFMEFGIYALIVNTLCSTYVLKAIYRIRKEVNKPRQYLSPNTLRMHKMLLKSLLWQTVAPIIIFVLPVILVVFLTFFRFPEKLGFSPESVTAFNSQLAAVVLAFPSLYTTVHVSSVIYFTTPYYLFVRSLLSWKRNAPPTNGTRLEVVDNSQQRRQSRQSTLFTTDIRISSTERRSSPVA